MDPRLAELYGTEQNIAGDDLEKAAAAEFAEGLSEGGEMSLDDLGEEELEALAQEVLAGEQGEEQGEEQAEEAEGPEFTEEEQEKLAEADFVGRAMAHAYVDELSEIEKEASVKGKLLRGAVHVRRGARKAGKWIASHGGSRAKQLLKGGRSAATGRRRGGVAEVKPAGNSLKAHFKGNNKAEAWKSTGTRAAAGGAALAAAEGGRRAISKEASAIDELAAMRAQELIDAGSQAEVTPYDVLADAVEQRAAEILAENGYELSE